MADLGRWLQGHYRVPGTAVAPDDDEADSRDPTDDDVKR
jgi:endogenous inhibitor of DNA gyrase (YacG/DUF329 family)